MQLKYQNIAICNSKFKTVPLQLNDQNSTIALKHQNSAIATENVKRVILQLKDQNIDIRTERSRCTIATESSPKHKLYNSSHWTHLSQLNANHPKHATQYNLCKQLNSTRANHITDAQGTWRDKSYQWSIFYPCFWPVDKFSLSHLATLIGGLGWQSRAKWLDTISKKTFTHSLHTIFIIWNLV